MRHRHHRSLIGRGGRVTRRVLDTPTPGQRVRDGARASTNVSTTGASWRAGRVGGPVRVSPLAQQYAGRSGGDLRSGRQAARGGGKGRETTDDGAESQARPGVCRTAATAHPRRTSSARSAARGPRPAAHHQESGRSPTRWPCWPATNSLDGTVLTWRRRCREHEVNSPGRSVSLACPAPSIMGSRAADGRTARGQKGALPSRSLTPAALGTIGEAWLIEAGARTVNAWSVSAHDRLTLATRSTLLLIINL
jgi:hypothetical protein